MKIDTVSKLNQGQESHNWWGGWVVHTGSPRSWREKQQDQEFQSSLAAQKTGGKSVLHGTLNHRNNQK